MDMADLDSDDNFEDIRGEQEEDAHYVNKFSFSGKTGFNST